jgi:hypothetical protein
MLMLRGRRAEEGVDGLDLAHPYAPYGSPG